jgi:hypothetical protein
MLTGRPVGGDFDEAQASFTIGWESFVDQTYDKLKDVPTIGIGYAMLVRNSHNQFVVVPTLDTDFSGIHDFSQAEKDLISNIAKEKNAGHNQAALDLFNNGVKNGLLNFTITEDQAKTLFTEPRCLTR